MKIYRATDRVFDLEKALVIGNSYAFSNQTPPPPAELEWRICELKGLEGSLPSTVKFKTDKGLFDYCTYADNILTKVDLAEHLVKEGLLNEPLKDLTVSDASNPDYYKCYPYESIEILEKVFGKEAVATFCLLTAFKHRMRLGYKGEGEKALKQDLNKEAWYLKKYHELTD